MIELAELNKHNTSDSCWVILYGKVYDVTNFLSDHPGGKKSILKLAGQDATEEFDLIHPPGTLEDNTNKLKYVGEVDRSELDEKTISNDTDPHQQNVTLPALEAQLNLDDFEATAYKLLNEKAWAYYHSASDDLITKRYNNEIYKTVLLRPRIFQDVTKVNTESSIAGYKTKLPIFVSPAAMARLAHPSGEKGIAHACGKQGVMQMISNNASMKFVDIVKDPIVPHQKFLFQLYVQTDRKISETLLREIVNTGRCQGIVLTLDAPTPGKREADERIKNDGASFSENSGTGKDNESTESEGLGRALFAGTAADLVWSTTIPWLVNQLPEGMPIILKGLQTHEDAIMATSYPNIKGILLSNHGGRAMDSAQPPLMVLQEIRRYAPQVFDKLEVYVDGGIRRGTDIVKALCLGAKQVGIGRAALYSLAGYGELGVERVLQILQEEIETAMRLLAAETIKDLNPRHVNTRQLDRLIFDMPNL